MAANLSAPLLEEAKAPVHPQTITKPNMAANLSAPLLQEGKALIRPENVTEQQFRRQQSDLAARFRSSAFSRTTYILAFVGVVLVCLTLFKIPNIDGGVPLPLNHEILISFASFALGSGCGILLTLSLFLMHLIACINGRKMNKTQPPSPEMMNKCFHIQKKLIRAIQVTEALIFIFGSSFLVYVFVVGVFGTFLPYKDANRYTGNSARLHQTATSYWILLKFLIDGFPRHWGF